MIKRIQKNKGAVVMVTVIFFLIITMAVIAGITIPTANQIKSVRDAHKARQSYVAADSLNDDAFYRLNQGKTLPSTLSLPFANNVTASASVTNSNGSMIVSATGVTTDTVRHARGVFSQGQVIGFNYGLHTGTGGLVLNGGSYVVGSVFSNGSITADSSNVYITGSAAVANNAPAVIDQSNSYPDGTSPVAVIAGNTNTTQDVAQSFKVTSSVPLTSVRLYVKKNANAGNATIRIVPDGGGKPSNSGTLGTGTLSASAVTTSFTYISIPITSVPSLTPGTTYWIVVDNGSTSATNYYTFGATNNTYADGIAKSGKWSTSPGQNSWNAVTPANSDLYFGVFLGGGANSISGYDQWSRLRIGTSGTGDAWANQVNSVSVAGTVYCQTGTFLYNLSNTEKSCNTTRPDPTTLAFPITDANIDTWKATASAGGTYEGSLSIGGGISTTTGPIKINGNLTVSGGTTLSLAGPVWVTGYIDLEGGSVLKLASSYGVHDGMIIADGRIITTGGGVFQGSGTSGSYIVAITTSHCPDSGNCSGPETSYALTIEGGSGSVVLFAPYGTARITGGALAQSVVAYKAILEGGAHINYETGLGFIDFLDTGDASSASSAWKVDSWTEVAD